MNLLEDVGGRICGTDYLFCHALEPIPPWGSSGRNPQPTGAGSKATYGLGGLSIVICGTGCKLHARICRRQGQTAGGIGGLERRSTELRHSVVPLRQILRKPACRFRPSSAGRDSGIRRACTIRRAIPSSRMQPEVTFGIPDALTTATPAEFNQFEMNHQIKIRESPRFEDPYNQSFQREQTVAPIPSQRHAVFVSDFDGTLARPNFYQLVREHLVPRGTPDYWRDYREGTMTHFDALDAFFASARGGEAALLDMIDRMEVPADLAEHVERFRDLGWEIVIVSAGCSWYIEQLLGRAGVQMPIFANPGRIVDGRLIMERPADSAHSCRETGIDKAAVVRSFQQETQTVAFAGDGFPDLEAARLVPAHHRFVRDDLAAACREEGLAFRPFEQWTEVTAALSQESVL